MEIEEIQKNADNKEYILQKVAEQGKLLEFASPNLQDDEEIVRSSNKTRWRSIRVCK